MNYEDIVNLLKSSSKFKINLGLNRMFAILKLLGNPHDKLKVIHIAGTNGKGSVCAVLANIFKCSGYKTALYTSPHLTNYRERIQINNSPIPEQEFIALIENINILANQNNIDLTEFELLTACAFKYFADNNVDIAIVETGLGGKLDATNVCSSPLLSIITSISLDHTNILGNSIEKIALEKAGIIKQNSAVIVSKSNQGFEIIKNQALLKNAKLIIPDENINIEFKNNQNFLLVDDKAYEFQLLGLFQQYNMQLVIAAVKYLKSFNLNLSQGLKTAAWHARMEYLKDKNLLIDGAHNPDAAFALRKSLDFYFPNQKRIFIYGSINTKDYMSIAKILFRTNDEIFYYEFNHNNAISLQDYLNNTKLDLKPFNKQVLTRPELKILTGSLYMIEDFLKNNFI